MLKKKWKMQFFNKNWHSKTLNKSLKTWKKIESNFMRKWIFFFFYVFWSFSEGLSIPIFLLPISEIVFGLYFEIFWK